MRILNPRQLPEAIVNAATPEEREVKPNRIGVTDLIGPAYLRALKIARWGELEEEVEKRWRLVIGTALHYYLDSKAPEGAATETKLQVTIGDHTVSGIPDIHHNGEIHDYKYTSVWSYIFGKVEWEQQLNVYAFLAGINGSEVKGLSILAFFYDWDENSMLRNPDYPKHPILKIPVVLWDPEKQREFVMERINAHIACEPCSPEERWRRPSTFAVMKEGRKTASRVLPTLEDAVEWCIYSKLTVNTSGIAIIDVESMLQKGISIVERVGEDRRCQDYCPVRAICPENIYNRKEVEYENREY